MRKILLVTGLIVVCAPFALAQEGAIAAGEGGIITGSNIVETFKNGGILMWPILCCSIIALAVMLERMVALRRSVVFPEELLAEIRKQVKKGDIKNAIGACEKNNSLFSKMIRAFLLRTGSLGFEMEMAIEEAGSRILYDLRRNMRPLGVIAEAAPLLGLMGTVFGMIKAFQVVAQSGALGRTELLAQGIGEALLTTAFGLVVAVFALVGYQFFRAKADNLLRSMEDACIEILEDIRKPGDKDEGADPK